MTAEPRGLRILIVDDERLIADTMGLILRRRGFHVDVAYSGEAALERAAHSPPDVLISDVVMEGMSGVEAALEICRRLPNCRVILISGQQIPAHLLDCARENGHTFEVLTKPVHPEVLLSRIQSLA